MDNNDKQLPAGDNQKAPPEILPRMARAAILRNDVGALVKAFCPNPQVFEALDAPAKTVCAAMASAIKALHNQDVAAIGNHEAFVRRSPHNGQLRQVMRPVRLSLRDGTLYNFKGTTKLTYEGFCRINAVVGAHVGLSRTVYVGGEEHVNPYVERMEGKGGRLGDIRRVVVAVMVIGPSPDTGNVVAVNYLLDYDPAKDLQHMLATLAEKHPADCFLIPEQFFEPERGWHWVPAAGGVGYAHNLTAPEVCKTYQKYINIVQNAAKKAQTVARRNAMRSHPAFAQHSVEIMSANDWAVRVPVVGWAVEGEAQQQWADVADRMAKGQAIDVDHIDIDTEDVSEVYDPERDDERAAGAATGHEASEADEATVERNLLISRIDDGVALLSPSKAEEYNARLRDAGGDYDQLKALLSALNAELDKLD